MGTHIFGGRKEGILPMAASMLPTSFFLLFELCYCYARFQTEALPFFQLFVKKYAFVVFTGTDQQRK
jgi:hypothetical protein